MDRFCSWLKAGAWGCITKERNDLAGPGLKGMLTERRGRDVGSAKSGFRPAIMDCVSTSRFPRFILALMGGRRTGTGSGTTAKVRVACLEIFLDRFQK